MELKALTFCIHILTKKSNFSGEDLTISIFREVGKFDGLCFDF